jgi:hypothetical protein
MAVIVPDVTRTPEGNRTNPLHDANLFVYECSGVGNGDTFDPGLTGIVKFAVSDISGGTVGPILSGGTFTIAASATAAFDLMVWTRG